MRYEQAERRFSVSDPTGQQDLLLLSEMTVDEPISGMFDIQLSLLSDEPSISFDDMIGGPLCVRMKLPEGGDVEERFFHGIISSFSQGAPSGRFIRYEAEVRPWLWFLSRGSDCRIFQRMSIPEIVSQVFDDVGMTDYKLQLKHTYPRVEYCVQYRETHLDFISRLLEGAGIAYFFDHCEDSHQLVLVDDPSSSPVVTACKEATYATAVEEGKPGEIEAWRTRRELSTGRYAVKDFNYKDPQLDLLAESPTNCPIGGNDRFERYDYPGVYESLSDGDSIAKRCMEAEEAAAWATTGESARGDFSAGHKFDLIGHYREDFNQSYLITAVSHYASQEYGDDEQKPPSYGNTFTCIPHSIPYRPPRVTPRPLISGAQTATVVGASGKEIDVDEFGAVLLQFHWDRYGKSDHDSSCRVRVAQNWAGKGFGAVFNPRIGQEVIVEFLEGDPDRPIVTGRVYNGEQGVPYSLPGNATQSGIKSRSSAGGGAGTFNEMKFEDKKGSELIYFHAQKDQTGDIENNRTENVGNDSSINIGNDLSQSVGNNEKADVGVNQTLSVGADRSRSVGGSESVTVSLQRTHTVGINETISVGGAQEVTVGALRSVTVGAAQSTSIGMNKSTSVGGSQSVEVSKDRTLKVGKKLTESIGEDYTQTTGKKLVIDAGDEITIKTGKATISMKKNGDIVIEGKSINVKGSGDIVMKGKKILEN